MKKILLPILLLLIILSGCKKNPVSEIESTTAIENQEMQASKENYQSNITIETLCEPTLEYDIFGLYENGLVLARNSEWKYGLIDVRGNTVVDFIYDGFTLVDEGQYSDDLPKDIFTEELAAAFKDRDYDISYRGKYGFIDKTGKEIIPFEYDWALQFSEGLAAVEKDGKYGYIDKHNNIVIPFEYDSAWRFNEGLAYVYKDDKCGVIDKTGKVIVPFEYRSITNFINGYAIACEFDENDEYNRGNCGVFDKSGNIVIPFDYKDIIRKSTGGTVFKLQILEMSAENNDEIIKTIYLDTSANEVSILEYINSSSEIELTAVEKDGKIGFTDEFGDIVVPFIYSRNGVYTNIFKNGFSVVKKDGKEGVINITGNEIIPCENSWIRIEGIYALVHKELGEEKYTCTIFRLSDQKEIVSSEYTIEYDMSNFSNIYYSNTYGSIREVYDNGIFFAAKDKKFGIYRIVE